MAFLTRLVLARVQEFLITLLYILQSKRIKETQKIFHIFIKNEKDEKDSVECEEFNSI